MSTRMSSGSSIARDRGDVRRSVSLTFVNQAHELFASRGQQGAVVNGIKPTSCAFVFWRVRHTPTDISPESLWGTLFPQVVTQVDRPSE